LSTKARARLETGLIAGDPTGDAPLSITQNQDQVNMLNAATSVPDVAKLH